MTEPIKVGCVCGDPCEKCGTRISLSERWDSHYCGSCDEWRETVACDDAFCFMCTGRPVRPSLRGKDYTA